jgi:hypothetical protein
MFKVDVDGSNNPITIDLSYLKSTDKNINGADIAAQVTAQMNKKFGDQSYFDLSDANNAKFNVIDSRFATSTTTNQGVVITTDHPVSIDLTQMPGYGTKALNPKQITTEQVQAEIQTS